MKKKPILKTKSLQLEPRMDQNEDIWNATWEITLKTEGTRIGEAGFGGPAVEHETEFHYHLMPDYAKQDYAGEIIQAMTQWAFGNPDVIFIKTEVELEHIEDKQVLEKCGFQLEGEGQKGPSFVLESTMTNWMTLYMLLGICIGMTFGNLYHNIAIGLSLGLCIGMALGSLTDYSTKKERNKLRENRAERRNKAE